MSITNTELTQITLEILVGLICVMIAIIIMLNRHREKSMKVFMWMFCIAATIFFAESGAFVFRGDLDKFSVVMTKVCNFIVFFSNYLLAYYFIKYVYSVVSEKGVELSSTYQKIANTALLCGIAILVTNIFTGWMYYFDSSNYYHRNVLWYVYTAISVFCISIGCFAAIKERKSLSQSTLISLVIYALVPILAIVIQSYVYGIAITNFGIGLGIIIMLFVYLFNWSKGEYIDEEADEKKRKLLQIIALLIIMTISMSASIVSCVVSIRRIAGEDSQSSSNVIAQMVGNGINNEFLSPIMASKTMANDISLKEFLKGDGPIDAKNNEASIIKYLTSIRDGFGYKMLFTISDKTRAYYTCNGIIKYIDIDNDPHDVWYKELLAIDKKYVLNVDTDEDNNWALSVFVNAKTYDENGDLLGGVGVGVDMNYLIDIIKAYEAEYNLDVKLVNKDGLIMVGSDIDKIEVDSIPADYFDKVGNEEFYYESIEGCARLSIYMEDLDWYLVIKDKNPNKIDVKQIVTPSVIFFLGGMFIMIITFVTINVREQKISKALREKRKASRTDELTGVNNRHAYEEDIDSMERSGNIKDVAVIMMDVNGLKTVNDNLGHSAGDELIIGAAQCMEPPFGTHGKVYRIGGDEFVAIMNCKKEKVEDAMVTFNHLVSNWKGKYVDELSVSSGVAYGEDYMKDDIRQIVAVADKLMYEDKERYYERTGKKRR